MHAESPPLSADRISGLMASPHDVAPADLPGLRVWRDRFPYASSLSVLVALAATKAGAVDQQSELLRAASGLASRDALFNLFVRPRLIEEARNFAREVERDASLNEPAPVEPAEPAGQAEPAEQLPPAAAPTGVERETLLAAIESSIEQDVRAWREEQPAPEAMSPTRAAHGQSPFAQWLAARAANTGFGEVRQQEAAAASPKGQSALIDAFIAANPRIGKLREVGGQVEDLARQSVLEDATLVTETMARVYAKQGQIGKARKAYELLALKYPAKSTYFAAQLKQLGKSMPRGEA